MNQPWYVILLLLTLSSSLTYVTCREIGGKVLLETVKAITLKKGKYTNSRRVSAIPQITCINGCHLASPNRIQCKNSGSDGVDIQWECSTDLPAGVSFEAVEVLCEGYDYPEDEYVLKGSCGVEYSLSGHRSDNHSQHSSWGNGYADSDPYGYSSSDYSYDRSESTFSFFRLFILIAIILTAYSCCFSGVNNTTNTGRGGGPGGGGGGGGNNWGGGGGGPQGGNPPGGNDCGQQGTGFGGGGFFPGAGLGGLLGYALGRATGGGGYGGYNNRYRRNGYAAGGYRNTGVRFRN
eukprot:GSMAST32.ASY1.ANO1.2489.1 assembled CDS